MSPTETLAASGDNGSLARERDFGHFVIALSASPGIGAVARGRAQRLIAGTGAPPGLDLRRRKL